MLRIIALIGNFIFLFLSLFFAILNIPDHEPEPFYIIFIPLIILLLINIYFISAIHHGTIFLYFKRKGLEEEIKIQEAKNKLKDLQSQVPNSLKEKNESAVV
jgi:hypothetical protein